MAQVIEFLQNHWLLSLLFLGFLISYAAYEFLMRRGGTTNITPQEAVRLMNKKGSKLFDLRDAEAFKEGHIIDAEQTSSEAIEAHCKKLKPDATIILVCQAGITAGKAGAKLKKAGFKHVYNISGGMRAWKQADLPTVTGK